MAALCNRAGHYILALRFVSSSDGKELTGPKHTATTSALQPL